MWRLSACVGFKAHGTEQDHEERESKDQSKMKEAVEETEKSN